MYCGNHAAAWLQLDIAHAVGITAAWCTRRCGLSSRPAVLGGRLQGGCVALGAAIAYRRTLVGDREGREPSALGDTRLRRRGSGQCRVDCQCLRWCRCWSCSSALLVSQHLSGWAEITRPCSYLPCPRLQGLAYGTRWRPACTGNQPPTVRPAIQPSHDARRKLDTRSPKSVTQRVPCHASPGAARQPEPVLVRLIGWGRAFHWAPPRTLREVDERLP